MLTRFSNKRRVQPLDLGVEKDQQVIIIRHKNVKRKIHQHKKVNYRKMGLSKNDTKAEHSAKNMHAFKKPFKEATPRKKQSSLHFNHKNQNCPNALKK